MVRDAKIQTFKFVDIVLTSLASEPADNIVEKVLEDVETAIDLYTPSKFRSKLHDSIFSFIYGLLPTLPAERENRITILKSKMNNFSVSEESILTMVKLLKNQDEKFKDIKMIGIQRWSTATLAFTINSLTVEEKDNLFDFVSGGSKGDVATKYRIRCNSLKSTEEEF